MTPYTQDSFQFAFSTRWTSHLLIRKFSHTVKMVWNPDCFRVVNWCNGQSSLKHWWPNKYQLAWSWRLNHSPWLEKTPCLSLRHDCPFLVSFIISSVLILRYYDIWSQCTRVNKNLTWCEFWVRCKNWMSRGIYLFIGLSVINGLFWNSSIIITLHCSILELGSLN